MVQIGGYILSDINIIHAKDDALLSDKSIRNGKWIDHTSVHSIQIMRYIPTNLAQY